jgi:hypothetical protein
MKQHQYTILADIAANLTLAFAVIACIACIAAMACPLFAPCAFGPLIGVFFAAMALAYSWEILSQWLHEQSYRQPNR